MVPAVVSKRGLMIIYGGGSPQPVKESRIFYNILLHILTADFFYAKSLPGGKLEIENK